MLSSDFATTSAEVRRVGYAIRDWGREIAHAHGGRGNKYAMIYRCAAGTPIVMTAHTRQMHLPWTFAHEIIAPSTQTVNYYLLRFLVRRKHMHVVPYMFDLGSMEPVCDEWSVAARKVLGLRLGSFVIRYVGGGIGHRKNQIDIDMVRLLAKVVQAGIDAELLLIGLLANSAREKSGLVKVVWSPCRITFSLANTPCRRA